MSCEIHDDTWHCFLQEGEMVHIKREEWKSGEIEPVEVKFPEGDPKSGHPKDELDSKIEFKTPESFDGKGHIIQDEYWQTGKLTPGTHGEFHPFRKIWDILNGEG